VLVLLGLSTTPLLNPRLRKLVQVMGSGRTAVILRRRVLVLVRDLGHCLGRDLGPVRGLGHHDLDLAAVVRGAGAVTPIVLAGQVQGLTSGLDRARPFILRDVWRTVTLRRLRARLVVAAKTVRPLQVRLVLPIPTATKASTRTRTSLQKSLLGTRASSMVHTIPTAQMTSKTMTSKKRVKKMINSTLLHVPVRTSFCCFLGC